MKKVNILFGIIGIAICIYIFFETKTFPEDTIMKIGPGFFPRLLAFGLGLFSLVLILQNAFSKDSGGSVDFSIKDPGVQRAGIVLLLTILYGIIMMFIGFIITTIIYLLVLMYLMKLRRWVIMLSVSVGVSVIVYLIFSVMLNIALPEAFWV